MKPWSNLTRLQTGRKTRTTLKGLPNANASALLNKNKSADRLFSRLSQDYLSERNWNRNKTAREAKLALERFENCIGNVDVT